VRGATNPL